MIFSIAIVGYLVSKLKVCFYKSFVNLTLYPKIYIGIYKERHAVGNQLYFYPKNKQLYSIILLLEIENN